MMTSMPRNALVLACLLAVPIPAGAHTGPGLGTFHLDLDLAAQYHGAVFGLLSADGSPPSFGGVEAYFSASIASIGAVASIGYDHWYRRDGARHGGYLLLGLQWRFLGLVEDHIYRQLDPHIGFGGRFGGISSPGEPDFLGAFYLDAGVTVALTREDLHPVLIAIYRFEAARTPGDLPAHMILFGVGLRAVD